MKKHYEKPEIQVVALELSEAIASCVVREDDPAFKAAMELVGANLTGDDESCTVKVEGYCYFTSGNILANS